MTFVNLDYKFNKEDEKTRQQKEYKLQCHIIEKHQQYFPHVVITHVPNRPSDAADGFFKKQLGVRPGVSDLIIWWSYTYPAWALKWLVRMLQYCGFSFAKMHSGVVELKVDSKTSTAQNKFLSAIHSLGGCEGVAHSWEEYYKLLCSFGIKPTSVCTIFDEPDFRTASDKKQDAFDMQRPL